MRDKLKQLIDSVGEILYGKEEQIKQAVTCLISGGHLLIEDQPGMGKTSLAHALAQVMSLDFQRLQFTSDMLPADIIGVSIFNGNSGEFVYHKGPVFTQLLLADEINRTTPKTQSALLEAMEEGQVSVEGETYSLPTPFFVIATQNPISQYGTFPLPESQLDRFLMRIQLGYPSEKAERELLVGGDARKKIPSLTPCLTPAELLELRDLCSEVNVSGSVLDYIQRLIRFTRDATHFEFGVSPRGSLALLNTAKTWAFLHGRDYVVPEDVQAMLQPVFAHRLRGVKESGEYAGEGYIKKILTQVDVLA
ncbi:MULTISPECIES: MoxR family ATPase [unclassified Neptuniibacter]|uniref:AAA family ATPase n=1 Tax=unclassified Neptuniibacter TaxID=2630693 RepID=UPI0026E1A7E3|nr:MULTISPECIES: MoxR family ATPase [unclassified Neptuniibacter]MDO6513443.1 MoxR family ATPase [Neptuniibacter sp. 2_MG-2023]MDO6593972.1 MoxR family ATPase [Neptuniibacter sp. 1_MG-2023]